jgi:hypothetical protein
VPLRRTKQSYYRRSVGFVPRLLHANPRYAPVRLLRFAIRPSWIAQHRSLRTSWAWHCHAPTLSSPRLLAGKELHRGRQVPPGALFARCKKNGRNILQPVRSPPRGTTRPKLIEYAGTRRIHIKQRTIKQIRTKWLAHLKPCNMTFWKASTIDCPLHR